MSYVEELSLGATGGLEFVLPTVLVPRYGGDYYQQPFDFSESGRYLAPTSQLKFKIKSQLLQISDSDVKCNGPI